MTKFNPENKESLTYGEALDPAMKITDPQDAQQYLAEYIKYTEKFLVNGVSETGHTAEQICKINLGYYAGYGSNELRERIERLFNCQHPVFGAIAQNGAPTPEEAFQKGLEIGNSNK